ncbi:MAG: hypothetical protein Q8K36_05470, partial [Alphaproteobacteria bacterium]|nr:hypothetical protein [Alphaproteobacteria bacterium]
MTYSAYKKTKQAPFPDKEWGGSLNIQPTFTPKFTTIKAHAFFYILGLIVFLYLGLKVLDYTNRYRSYETITTNLMNKAYHLVMPKLTAQDTAPQPPAQAAPQPGNETQGNAQVNPQANNPTNAPAPTKVASKKNEKESAFDPLGITSPSQVRLLESLGARHQEL